MEQIDFYKNFRHNLRVMRVARNISAIELCDRLGMKSKKRITDLEYGLKGRGIPKPHELYKIAEIFGLSVDQLINERACIVFRSLKALEELIGDSNPGPTDHNLCTPPTKK